MRKSFHLPLLSALPALLVACGGDDDDLSRYNRVEYASYQQCMVANQAYIEQGLENPCAEEDDDLDLYKKKKYYGPFLYYTGSGTRFVGYTSSGGISPRGLTYDSKKGTYGSFKAPVSRGGLTSSARGGTSGMLSGGG
ncbi:hypothetical protein DEDE109153_16170 [Deinococcus deserti]|uniref:Lipoprotein n=1 Tax=Deinococcus deserti (strain DSM 17065 / CIP 109153 / LMG 22923 / VCD115) TaxID=546414 RepID=C1CWU8_DEIDV|nr:hypothetical protein [Deinococcus deserti]ACO46665.1 Hypothetical protein Deide_16940 [Deinococcus deserti VCD115]